MGKEWACRWDTATGSGRGPDQRHHCELVLVETVEAGPGPRIGTKPRHSGSIPIHTSSHALNATRVFCRPRCRNTLVFIESKTGWEPVESRTRAGPQYPRPLSYRQELLLVSRCRVRQRQVPQASGRVQPRVAPQEGGGGRRHGLEHPVGQQAGVR